MNKTVISVAVVILLPVLFVGGLLLVVIAGSGGDGTGTGTAGGLKGVPADFQPWIELASQQCKEPELTPGLLAAQLNQESHFSTTAVSGAGAEGPAQFTPGTWATWGRDVDGGGADPYDIGDAVMAQGRMMCSLIGQAKASGIPGATRAALALAGYNAGWGAVLSAHGVPPYPETQHYVKVILATIKNFQGPVVQFTGSGAGPDAVRRAGTELGVPYSWGGGSPAGPSTGFCSGNNGYLHGTCVAATTVGWDCSSLTQYAYWPTLHLPRTAAEQYDSTADHPVARADLHVGDLLFWSHGGDTGIYHVALYAGANQMLEAPRTGQNVKLAPLTSMPAADYYGATRP